MWPMMLKQNNQNHKVRSGVLYLISRSAEFYFMLTRVFKTVRVLFSAYATLIFMTSAPGMVIV